MHRLVLAAAAVLALTVTATAWADPREGEIKSAPEPGSFADRPHAGGHGSGTAGPLAHNFRVLGHNDLGLQDSNGDVGHTAGSRTSARGAIRATDAASRCSTSRT